MTEIRMPGTVYRECFDPAATQAPGELGLPAPTRAAIGVGHRYTYDVDAETAEMMLDHAEEFGEAISAGVDDPSVGRAILRWVDEERARIGLLESEAVISAGEYEADETTRSGDGGVPESERY